MSKLNNAAQFFFKNAGYSWDTNKETPEQGRERCALNLEAAEAFAREAGYSFEWDVSDIDSSDFNDGPEVWALYGCVMRDLNGKVVQSLAGCDFGKDADGPYGDYRRVVEAELAAEEMHSVMAAA